MATEENIVEGEKARAGLSDEHKARILDGFLSLIILQADSAGIIRYLRGEGYEEEAIFYQHIDADGNSLRNFLAELFEPLSCDETDLLFREFLPVVLADELGAKKVLIEWD